MRIPISWTERNRIRNLPQLTERVRSRGGSIIAFERVWSLGVVCCSGPVYRWVGPGSGRYFVGLGHALFCFLFGWWSPAGIFRTLPAVVNNLLGGVDVTRLLSQPPPLPGQPWDPVATRDYTASRQRQSILTILTGALVTGSICYIGWHHESGPKPGLVSMEVIPITPGQRVGNPVMNEESRTLKLRIVKYGEQRNVEGTSLYIKIAEPLRPMERWTKYEDPLVAALHKGNLGEITGGGALIQPDGKIKSCGIDVVVADPPEKGIAVIRAVLRAAGAPKGSEIVFTDSHKSISVLSEE